MSVESLPAAHTSDDSSSMNFHSNSIFNGLGSIQTYIQSQVHRLLALFTSTALSKGKKKKDGPISYSEPLETSLTEGGNKIVHEANATKQRLSECVERLEADGVIFQERYVVLIKKQTWLAQTQRMIGQKESTCRALCRAVKLECLSLHRWIMHTRHCWHLLKRAEAKQTQAGCRSLCSP